MGELPRWRAEIAAQMKTTPVPDALAREFQLFQQMQLLSSHAFSEQLPAIMTQLKALPSRLSKKPANCCIPTAPS